MRVQYSDGVTIWQRSEWWLVNFSNGHRNSVNKQCGEAATIYAPAPCNGSAQWRPWARPAEPGPMSQYAPSQPAGPAECTRQTSSDRRQTSGTHHRLMPPLRGRGITSDVLKANRKLFCHNSRLLLTIMWNYTIFFIKTLPVFWLSKLYKVMCVRTLDIVDIIATLLSAKFDGIQIY